MSPRTSLQMLQMRATFHPAFPCPWPLRRHILAAHLSTGISVCGERPDGLIHRQMGPGSETDAPSLSAHVSSLRTYRILEVKIKWRANLTRLDERTSSDLLLLSEQLRFLSLSLACLCRHPPPRFPRAHKSWSTSIRR